MERAAGSSRGAQPGLWQEGRKQEWAEGEDSWGVPLGPGAVLSREVGRP